MNLEPKTILLVDLDEGDLRAGAAGLREAGLRVVTHPRSIGCVDLVLSHRPDAVVLDASIAPTRVEFITRMIRSTSTPGATKVLLHWTRGPRTVEQMVRQAGADGVVEKTRDWKAFARAVRSAVEGPRSLLPPPPAFDGALFEIPPAPPSHPPRADSMVVEREVRVLLVGPDVSVLNEHRRTAQGLGYDCEFALSVGKGLRKLEAPAVPDLVVVDDDLPDDGAREFRRLAVERDALWESRVALALSSGQHRTDWEEFRGSTLIVPILAQRLADLVDQVRRSEPPRKALA